MSDNPMVCLRAPKLPVYINASPPCATVTKLRLECRSVSFSLYLLLQYYFVLHYLFTSYKTSKGYVVN